MPIEMIREDITRMRVDAIVNAANNTLLGGGGVDGAIHDAAGPELLEECRRLGGCETGEAKITGGYRLPAKYVIHTVGPVWQGGGHGEREQLTACYRNSLRLAEENGCESIAFPMISTGVYGYPKEEALDVALSAAEEFLATHEMTIWLVVFGREMYMIGDRLFSGVKAYIDDAYADRFDETGSRRSRLCNRRQERRSPVRPEPELTAPETADRMICGAPLKSETVRKREKPRKGTGTAPDEAVYGERGGRTAAARREPVWETAADEVSIESLSRYLLDMDIGFSDALLQLIDLKGMTDAECYKRANIDRKLFNHIKNDKQYRPSKKTALAFTVALGLKPDEAEKLVNRAGYTFSDSDRLDRAIRFFLMNGVSDIHRINIMLFELDLPTLGV